MKKKLKTFRIILTKNKSLFQVDLGPVKATGKKDALRVGKKLCDAMESPEWKKKITVIEN